MPSTPKALLFVLDLTPFQSPAVWHLPMLFEILAFLEFRIGRWIPGGERWNSLATALATGANYLNVTPRLCSRRFPVAPTQIITCCDQSKVPSALKSPSATDGPKVLLLLETNVVLQWRRRGFDRVTVMSKNLILAWSKKTQTLFTGYIKLSITIQIWIAIWSTSH
jgi:hypothetical protein